MAIELFNPEQVPYEVKISIDGQQSNMLVNPGRVFLPPTAELLYKHPKLKHLGGSPDQPDQTSLDLQPSDEQEVEQSDSKPSNKKKG
jgi:hypothetical protein